MTALAALGWSLFHSLWQGALAAGGARLAITRLEASGPASRLRVAAVALGLLTLALPLTAGLLLWMPTAPAALLGIRGCGCGAARVGAAGASSLSLLPALALAATPLLAALAGAWLVGAAWGLLRIGGGVARLRRIRRRARPLPRWPRLPYPVLVSDELPGPVAFGHRRPVILLPRRCLETLSREELAAVVEHETEHLRRGDFSGNVVRAVAEALLFFHPAARWLSRRIAEEREYACDDAAVLACGDRLTYARALWRLEALRSDRPALALPAGGGSLTSRLRRLAEHPPTPAGRRARASVAGRWGALALLVAGASGAWTMPVSAAGLSAAAAPPGFTVMATDPGGEFTLTVEAGRVVEATLDGDPLAATQVRQDGPRVRLLDPEAGWFEVELKESGIRWAPRPPDAGEEPSRRSSPPPTL